jgi:hypothetical protein
MAGVYINRADPFHRNPKDKGYCVGWKLRYGFERGRTDEDITYAEAAKKAKEMGKKEPGKVFWPEMIMDPKFQM